MGIRALLVDDDPAHVLITQEMLVSAGALVPLAHASTLAEAVTRLENEAFDLVLLDLNLPDSTGVETVSSLRSHFPSLPVVVLTGDGPEPGLAALRLGAQDYLEKNNVQPALLRRVMLYAVERAKLRARLDAALGEREAQAIPLPASPVSGRLYESPALREAFPEGFSGFVKTYVACLERALEERLFQEVPLIPQAMRDMAEDLGVLHATPRDVVEIHLAGLKEAMSHAPRAQAQAFAEEGRIMVLNLMGHLASFYRNFHLASQRKGKAS